MRGLKIAESMMPNKHPGESTLFGVVEGALACSWARRSLIRSDLGIHWSVGRAPSLDWEIEALIPCLSLPLKIHKFRSKSWTSSTNQPQILFILQLATLPAESLSPAKPRRWALVGRERKAAKRPATAQAQGWPNSPRSWAACLHFSLGASNCESSADFRFGHQIRGVLLKRSLFSGILWTFGGRHSKSRC